MASSSQPASQYITLGTLDPSFHKTAGRVRVLRSMLGKHIHLIGLSGNGKSSFLAALVLLLLNAGETVFLIDPHGDLASRIKQLLVATGAYAQPGAFERILYLDIPEAERRGRFAPFNVLNQSFPPHVTSRLVVEAMRRTWEDLADGHAVGMENIVLEGTKLLLYNHMPLTVLPEVLADSALRTALLTHCPDHTVRHFFTERYDKWGTQRVQNIEPVLRRLRILTHAPTLRYGLAFPDNLFDFSTFLAKRQSVIINLALADSEERRLYGGLLTVYAEQAALARAAIPENERHQAHLILDEFPQFTATSQVAFETMLAQTRKYNVSLILANQTLSQIPPRLRGALQNCGIHIAFGLGREDALAYAPLFGRVDPMAVKLDIVDPTKPFASRPVFYSLPEQWEQWAQALIDLPPQYALMRAGRDTLKLRALTIPDLDVDEAACRSVEETYLARLFREPPDEPNPTSAAASPSQAPNDPRSKASARPARRTKPTASVPDPLPEETTAQQEDDDELFRENK